MTGTPRWGQRWIEEVVRPRGYDEIRISRGRAAVARGVVESFEIEPSSVGGAVAGRGALVRRVRLGIARLPADEWDTVATALVGSGRGLADILDGRLPVSVDHELRSHGVSLMPWPGQVSVDCSCGDVTERCSHGVAVLVRVAEELDRDPLALLTLRGGDRGALLQRCRESLSAATARGGRPRPTVPGRAAESTVSLRSVTSKRPAELPPLPTVRAHTAAPVVGTGPPPSEFGFTDVGLQRLVADAAARAVELLSGSGPLPDLDVTADAVRRYSTGGLSAQECADACGVDLTSVDALVQAWVHSGEAGVEVLVRPRRLTPDEVTLVAARFGDEVRQRSTGALVGSGRQLRRSTGGRWVLVSIVDRPNVVASADQLSELDTAD